MRQYTCVTSAPMVKQPMQMMRWGTRAAWRVLAESSSIQSIISLSARVVRLGGTPHITVRSRRKSVPSAKWELPLSKAISAHRALQARTTRKAARVSVPRACRANRQTVLKAKPNATHVHQARTALRTERLHVRGVLYLLTQRRRLLTILLHACDVQLEKRVFIQGLPPPLHASTVHQAATLPPKWQCAPSVLKTHGAIPSVRMRCERVELARLMHHTALLVRRQMLNVWSCIGSKYFI